MIRSIIFDLFLPLVMSIPSYTIRHLFLRILGMNIGKKSSILRKSYIYKPSNITIGDNCVINSQTILDGRGGRIIIGDNVDIARDVYIWTLEHDPHDDYHRTKGGNVIIEDYVWISSRATILPNVTIGKGAVVASGAIVTRDVPPMTVVGGIPAKIISQRKSNLKYNLNYRPLFR